MKTISGICKLCQKPSELQNSHIISEFFYKLIYDSKPRRLHVISTQPSIPVRYEQKGLREFLLCRPCEGKIGKWENYTKREFIDCKNVKITQMQNEIVLRGVDYKRFKLLQLSLLWRMSVSKHPFFSEVSLGQKHEERLRQALLNEDPLRPEDYSCPLEALTLGGTFYPDCLSKPWTTRHTRHRVYMIVIAGVCFSFFVGSDSAPREAVSSAINQRNELTIAITEIRDDPFLYKAFLELGEAVKGRKRIANS